MQSEPRFFQNRHFYDSRGLFIEAWKKSSSSLPEFRQCNVSVSAKNVIRGLHFQTVNPQGKLVSVLSGWASDMIVDLRVGSPKYGVPVVFQLTPGASLYVPPGFAHGFHAVEDRTVFHYLCTEEWHQASDGGIYPLSFDWGISDPIVSQKDLALPRLNDFQSPFKYEG